MSKTTTGRRLLDDLERRVAKIEGNGKPDPLDQMRKELQDIYQRLNELEAEKRKSPANNTPPVVNG